MSIGLVLISHGSPLAKWNMDQFSLCNKVETLLRNTKNDVFKSVKWAWLEFSDRKMMTVGLSASEIRDAEALIMDDIPAACDKLEKEGVTRIIAVPIFIATSSHSSRDIPNALGIMFHPEQDDNSESRYMGAVPITLTPTLDHGCVLVDLVSDSALNLTLAHPSEPSECAVVVLSHGDGCEHFWGHLQERIRLKIVEKTKIQDCTHVYIQTMRKPVVVNRFVDSIHAAERRDRTKIFVVSCFNGTGGATFIERAKKMFDEKTTLTSRPGVDVIGDESWTGDHRLPLSIAKTALEAGLHMLGRKHEVAAIFGEDDGGAVDKGSLYPPYNPPFFYTRDKGKEMSKDEGKGKDKDKGKGKGKGI